MKTVNYVNNSIICLLLLAGFALCKTQTVDSMKDKIGRSKSLSIVFCDPLYIDVGFRINTNVDSKDVDAVFKQHFVKMLPEVVKRYSSCTSVQLDILKSGQKFFSQEIDKESFEKSRFIVPEEGDSLQLETSSPDLVLMIHNAAIIAQNEDSNWSAANFLGRINISFSCAFVLWSTKERKIAAYGMDFVSESTDEIGITMEDIFDFMDKVGEMLIEDTQVGRD